AEARVTAGDRPPCSGPEKGQLWFNVQRKGLFICDGMMWMTLVQNKERLDYVEDYQDLYTRSETFDVEVFSIPSEGLFMAAANRYQNTSTAGLHDLNAFIFILTVWFSFTGTLDRVLVFLVVADIRKAEPELSVIYRWNRRQKRFLRYQTLETHAAQDWEAFQIHNNSFLVVANHRRVSGVKMLEVFAEGTKALPCCSASIWWNPDTKVTVAIDDRFFLAVANSQQLSSRGPSLYNINSTVYELNMFTQTFIRFQDILTYRWQGYEGFVPVHSLPTFGCRDWEHFTTDQGSFLIYSSATSRLSKNLRELGQYFELQQLFSLSTTTLGPLLNDPSVSLADINTLLRHQLSQSEWTNQALREDLQKLTADWTRAVEESEQKEADWQREKEVCRWLDLNSEVQTQTDRTDTVFGIFSVFSVGGVMWVSTRLSCCQFGGLCLI
ncbi:hypothetical protein GOODEAATRI_015313, partial [Goodea atripinnis]